MTDEELADYLHIPTNLVRKISPEKRLAYERMREVEDEPALWEAGIGEKPKGVILCR